MWTFLAIVFCYFGTGTILAFIYAFMNEEDTRDGDVTSLLFLIWPVMILVDFGFYIPKMAKWLKTRGGKR